MCMVGSERCLKQLVLHVGDLGTTETVMDAGHVRAKNLSASAQRAGWRARQQGDSTAVVRDGQNVFANLLPLCLGARETELASTQELPDQNIIDMGAPCLWELMGCNTCTAALSAYCTYRLCAI